MYVRWFFGRCSSNLRRRCIHMPCHLCYAIYAMQLRAMQAMFGNICYAIYALQYMLRNRSYAIYALLSTLGTLCSPCFAICPLSLYLYLGYAFDARQSMLCNPSILCRLHYAIYALQSVLCNFCYVVYAVHLDRCIDLSIYLPMYLHGDISLSLYIYIYISLYIYNIFLMGPDTWICNY